MPTTQISAHISLDVKERMERYVRMSGTTRTHLVEQAILHHLQALDELPRDAIIPVRLVLSSESAESVRAQLSHPPEPTEEMLRLFDDR